MNCANIFGLLTIIATVATGSCGVVTTGIPNASNATTRRIDLLNGNHDDIHVDDFVPYQGERFSSFDWSLFAALCKKQSDNLLVSPISLKIALVLLYEGSQDQSALEIAQAMRLPATLTATRDRFTGILRSLRANSPAYKVNIGTRIYTDAIISIRQRYQAIAETFYATGVKIANFSNAQPIVQEINQWVSNVTDGNIERLVEDESKIKNSLMVITNAIYFKGSWYRKYFSEKNTRNGAFYIGSNRTVQVPLMQAIDRFYYIESSELNAKILRIPYDGHKFAMYLLLPYSKDGIDKITNNINQFVLTRHMWHMQDLPVDVIIPKFKFEDTNHLESVLRKLGIRDIFDDTATLTGIAQTKRASRHLKVTDIYQKAGIEVNENGTTAYAATEVELGNKIKDETFHATHPFVFYIEDETTGTILYIGRVTNPLDALQAGLNADDRDNLFNTYLTQSLSKERQGNLILSPASIKAALTMITEASSGETKAEIVSTLRLPDSETQIRKTTQRTLASLKRNENGTEIDVSTCFWVNRNLNILDSHKDALQTYYHANVESVNFDDSLGTAQKINDFVRRATRGQLRSPVLTGIPPNTQLLLTSVIYFKGAWLKAFDRKKTKLECFYLATGECVNTYFMNHESTYRYAYISSIEAEVIEIPYSNGETSMLTIMPNKREKDPYLRALSKDLSTVPVSAIFASLKERNINIHLPKFTIQNTLNLVPALQSMGIESIFAPTANLTRVAINGALRVTSILQNVKIEVSEEGTLAAADTEVAFELLASWTNDIRLDKPFLFLIVDSVTKMTLFSGRFMGPLE
ncbi:uncharacterized protein LOC143208714 isoform X2 [Lasioglossum baleicum]|uniref:uncharacterized protein LOC143208714 isoform X2 n=1 Tax=Lasioglossum baleicum TaxID=434251 RepID=UPI003FCDD3C6